MQIAVTDPKTNLTSEKSEALEFAVAGEKTTNAPGVIEEDDAPPLTLNPIFWVILSAVIVGVSVGGYFGYRKIKGKKAKIKEEKTEELEKPSQE
ncbi:MAG: hypothetical protein UT18_C0026G0005 [candidate division CPR2 bacterium GW2011_GWC2_39_10]|uniref:Uncharacterized protein n=1 Tax=candidate division CPR2 bacterium GW2011_GWC2_39_10 TaxID=1618345 RepID=A0A0G0LYR6_UNCC2|nr:MAG: hypothetical protein UT18_C0026G0005 [candidate division CPR2 bacterium GW2011_GWC2_39_10]